MTGRRTLATLAAGVLMVTSAGTLATAHDGGGHGAAGEGTPFHEGASRMDRLRFSTAPYFDVGEAVEDGFGELQDAEGIACIDDPAGGMGIHYVHGGRVGDDRIRLRRPEAVIYEPQPDGDLELVGVEYVVFEDAWRETHPKGRPHLFGRKFARVGADNRYGIPTFFELHVWAWRENPRGTFEDWNPDVTCEFAP